MYSTFGDSIYLDSSEKLQYGVLQPTELQMSLV